MNTSAMSSHESVSAVEPATPPQKQSTFKLVCGFLSCRLVESLSRPTLDEPRKRYLKERKVYQQYMKDQEKQEQEGHNACPSIPWTPSGCVKFSFKIQNRTESLGEGVKDLINIRKRLHRRRYKVKPGSPPPRQPPCCPHWDKEQASTCKSQKKGAMERLSVYEPGQITRRERYEERLRDPTSKEARRKAACEEARRSSTVPSTSSGRSDKVDAEMERLRQRVRDIERRNAVLVGSLGVKPARKRKDQTEKCRQEGHRIVDSSIGGMSSGGRSLGTIALKGNNLKSLGDTSSRRRHPLWADTRRV